MGALGRFLRSVGLVSSLRKDFRNISWYGTYTVTQNNVWFLGPIRRCFVLFQTNVLGWATIFEKFRKIDWPFNPAIW